MDFFEAMKRMKLGECVRLKSWPENSFIGIKEEEQKVFGNKKIKYSVVNADETDISPLMPFSILVKSEWELFEE